MHVFLHFKTSCSVVLQFILASKLSDLEQFENWAANYQLEREKVENEPHYKINAINKRSFRKGTSGVGDVAVKLNLKGGLLSCILH